MNEVVTGVLKSARYRQVDPGLVRSLAQDEVDRRRSLKEAVKAVKDTLHQAGGAYLETKMAYAAWLEELHAAYQEAEVSSRLALRKVMSHHASTRERLPILDDFYAACLGGLPPIRSVLDIACGLNPLAIPWMGLAPGASYHAVDIYQDMMAFLDAALAFMPVLHRVETRDVIAACPDQPVDLALVLKTIPCLEQIDKSAGERLLGAIQAQVMLVSFPLRSLGGREVGMAVNYEKHFLSIARNKPWKIERFSFSNELVFRVSR
jgi:16S rRNA (guanine(1405)-N(7))-methyltransferase